MFKPLSFLAFWARVFLLALTFSLLVSVPARADVAPPESPPGSGISPGEEVTEVRMLSERVTLTIQPNREREMPRAKTEASFLMRNLGLVEEKMDVRFPLLYGESLYYSDMFPEIQDIQVQVDGKTVSTTRTTSRDAYDRGDIPWASFPVAFPPGQDVNITVTYTTIGFGYEPFIVFQYILETGAGWKDSIGSGEIVLILPYQANSQNVVVDDTSGNGNMTKNLEFSGNQARWRFENLEPDWEDNFAVTIIQPSAWQKVLREREITVKNPNDGEAWGRLGKALKEIIRYPKGYLRADEGVAQMYLEAVSAYDRSVTLLPKDALWHYGFADLLWSHYLFDVHYAGLQDVNELVRLTGALNQSLALDPKNQNARDLADWISYTIPGVIVQTEQGYNFLALTATPTIIPPTASATLESVPAEATPLLPTESPTSTLVPTPSPIADEAEPATVPAMPSQTVPFCGGAAMLLPFLAGLAWLLSRRV